MTRQRFEALIEKTGPIAPEGLEEYIADLESDARELLPREALQYVLDWNHVPETEQEMIFLALDAVNAIPELVELSHVMAQDAVRALNRCTAIEVFQPRPKCLEGFAREAFGFLYTQLCVIEGRKALRKRGVPEKYDMDIPERMTRKQLGKFVSTGDIRFDDYPWDMNFYCCDIFLMDRFYFIPYRWGDELTAWRNRKTGEVTALWRGNARVRRDGQLDGVNGVFDPQAFTTRYEERADTVAGNPVSPEGHILETPTVLNRQDWEKVLQEGDYLLALHIPGGRGYTPERVKKSCEMALSFYERYYPEYRYLGFWSESWLFDPGLAEILGPERNISRVQRQFYCYPTMEGERMTKLEVMGEPDADYRKRTARTQLEKGLFAAWNRGEKFHCTGMFLLREEIPLIGNDPFHSC